MTFHARCLSVSRLLEPALAGLHVDTSTMPFYLYLVLYEVWYSTTYCKTRPLNGHILYSAPRQDATPGPRPPCLYLHSVLLSFAVLAVSYSMVLALPYHNIYPINSRILPEHAVSISNPSMSSPFSPHFPRPWGSVSAWRSSKHPATSHHRCLSLSHLDVLHLLNCRSVI